MASFVFVGNGRDDPDSTVVFGHKFDLNGNPVEVSDLMAAKLAGNNHFRQLDGLPSDKSQLEAIARRFGVEIDKRKTVATLQRQVQELIDDNADAGSICS